MTRYHKREIMGVLLDSLKNMPVVVLSGMRQTGKSTLLSHQSELKGYKYFNLDDYAVLEAARENPLELLTGHDRVIIDEVQKLPSLLTDIKRLIDRKRTPGQFLLSGSANLLLLKSITESLAGRAVYLNLQPFSTREISGNVNRTPVILHFFEKNSFPKRKCTRISWPEIVLGGMPSVCLREVKDSKIWFRGFEQTYLERDIRDLSQVADLVSFRNLIQLVALRNSQILNQSELARDAKLNVVTTSRYLSLLETSFLLSRIPPYLGNPTTRLIKSPKIYLSDTGIAAHLSGIKDLSTNHALRGAYFESYVAQNLHSILSTNLPDASLSYWNVQGRYEVDFVIENGRETLAIEVKSGGRWQAQDIKGLKVFLDTTPSCRAGILAYNGDQVVKLGEKIWAVPISLLIG